ncbi:MAG: alpha/beta hydrolase [Spirochaetes bacterium]|nr:alpha/beta hydrolase [Spirochaetota bacterium]
MIRNAIIKLFIRMYRSRLDRKNYVALRRGGERYASRFIRLPESAEISPTETDGIPAEWIVPRDTDKGRCILYLHGGGYVICSPRTHRDLVWRIGRRSRARSLVIDYRLAPEHPHPAALEDAMKAYRWLIKNGVDPVRLAVMGDSAGGGLTLALLLALRDAGDPLPACAVCLSPWSDLTASGASMETHRRKDPLLDPESIAHYAGLYSPGGDFTRPYVSPLFGDFRGLPPLLIHVGGAEVLLDDSRCVAEKASAAGVQVEFKIWPRMIHVFQALAFILPDARKAIREIGEFTLRHIP